MQGMVWGFKAKRQIPTNFYSLEIVGAEVSVIEQRVHFFVVSGLGEDLFQARNFKCPRVDWETDFAVGDWLRLLDFSSVIISTPKRYESKQETWTW